MSFAYDPNAYRNQWNTPWGDYRLDDALRHKWPTGKSAPVIARELASEHGIVVNGDSVLNRARRLRLPVRASKWTPEIDARLRELWSSGKQLKEIPCILNAEFATQFTRNAVIGRAHRVKLEKRRKPLDIVARIARQKEHWRRYKERNRDKIAARERERRQAARPPAPDIIDQQIPEAQRKTLMQLGPRDCRFPVGDPDQANFFFCGGVAEEGHAYCDAHCRRAYNLSARCSAYARVAA